jgi:hypothetical protein
MTRLVFDILSYWLVGGGVGQMATFDERPVRDSLGLPCIPGRQVKGLCRQAMLEAEALFPAKMAGMTDALFGTRAEPGRPLQNDPAPAKLRFDDARLPESERESLAGHEDLIAQLYSTRRCTAMNDAGVARPRSLRFEEVVVPLKLVAGVQSLREAPEDWSEMLSTALPLLNAIGSDRTRGLGRVIVSLED